MITKSLSRRDCHRYLRHCFLTWGVQSLDLYSRMNHSCNRDKHWMNHWNDLFEIMMSFPLLDILEPIYSPYPIEQYSSQRDIPQHKLQEGRRSPVPNRYIERTDDFVWGRNQKLKRLTLRSEEHTSELQSLMRISYAVFCLNKKN